MSGFLYRLGGSAAAHPWRTISAWVLVAAVAFALAGSFGGTPQDDYDVPGARAQAGIEMLRDHAPAAAGASAQVVVHDPTGRPLSEDLLAAMRADLSGMDHVSAVLPPRVSADSDTALVTVQYDVPVTHPDLAGETGPLEEAVAPAVDAGLQVELGGELPGSATAEMDGRGELIGVVVALLLLVIAFGSVVGSGLPVVIALVGLGVGTAGIGLLAAAADVSTAAPTVATMVGLGVGIDYALLLVTRHVEHLRQGYGVREAAARAAATAGRSVVFASATVLVSLMGLRLAGLPVYSSFGFATAIAVVAVMAAALTLVPALSGLAGQRLLPRKIRRQRPVREREPFTARWAAMVGRRPLPWALAAVLLMLTLAAPTLAMRTWPQDASSQSQDMTTRQAYDLVAEEFGAGANGPFTVVVDREQVSDERVASMAAELGEHPGVAAVSPAQVSPDGAIVVVEAQPEYGPTDERTGALVEQLRTDVLPRGAELTGMTPLFADIADMLAERIWLVIGFVVGVSVLLLAMVFRSVVVPLKAAVMNLLSIGAAYGVVTAAFQWGWATDLLGLDHAMPVSSWVPILMFAILFGLSMDYEVFLLSRIREDWQATGDARGSVVRGLSATGRVISAAAAIMVAVFLGFATEADVVVKMLGFGMAVAIALDATVVRMVLVPATMAMLGHRNWWLPGWLDRLLPHVDAEVSVDGPAVPTPEPVAGDDEARVPAGV
ncbi:MAG TPA: MMPL family transporter [Nocardioidaceae bacterium]|nr:MMPL family transporter [Nocardioidaceae bacterium]